MKESFSATTKILVNENNKKQLRHLIKQLIALEAIDEETGESIILGTFYLK